MGFDFFHCVGDRRCFGFYEYFGGSRRSRTDSVFHLCHSLRDLFGPGHHGGGGVLLTNDARFEGVITRNKKAIIMIAFFDSSSRRFFSEEVFERNWRPALALHFDDEGHAACDQAVAFRNADAFNARRWHDLGEFRALGNSRAITCDAP